MLSGRAARRAAVRGVLIALVLVLALTVIGFLIASILLAFLTIVTPPVATLLTAVCLAAVALLLALVVVIQRRRHGGVMREASRLLPSVLGIIRRRPMGAVGTALALGVMAELLQRNGGASGEGRRKT